ncbi:DUF1622 domain-containing protein [Lachnotalea sp. AF33-28]|uniref:DUF1622 domain-containing protein n=1 Tax=Lachnotalea sp. AF33-28 TaxID=2292046 RepID=UPI000E525304|nr:DUF1622 domain-containing protein [Lachnotalea sp. AF33-28]RHP35652.1 DUF1622 domain-containing protein [Lachnotalea sp. AF33-28]
MFEEILTTVVTYLIHILECMGILVITIGAVKAFALYLKSGFHSDHHDIKLDFARTLAFALEFKLGGEILRTVITKTFNEMYVLAAIIVLRAILTFVIHYEIKFDSQN